MLLSKLSRISASLLRSTRHNSLSTRRFLSSKPLTEAETTDLLSKPTWSVSSLLDTPPPQDSTSTSASTSSQPASSTSSPPSEPITPSRLHHLLRLSALPLPRSPEQEKKMIADLESQLRFVRAVQSVDTEGVEPLVAIRDETKAGKRESEITVESLRAEFEKEEVVGVGGRIRRKRVEVGKREGKGLEGKEENKVDGWELLKQAPVKRGRYVVVNTRTS